MQITININCDMGEREGHEGLEYDLRLLGYVSSVNIACGFHAGDEHSMRTLAKACFEQHKSIGAHPSFDDRKNFGRSEVFLTNEEIYQLVLKQLVILGEIAKEEGGVLQHVKPHGALYNMAAKDATMAGAIAHAVFDYDPDLLFVGLAGSHLISEALKRGLDVSREAFADRRYERDATLRSRKKEGALLPDTTAMYEQVLMICTQKKVIASDGSKIDIEADTICIHSDDEHALEFASGLKEFLLTHNITIQ
ncbi:MAG: LamB/YcsF family protein [Chitinophagaceae bacterium]|nr:MAG: LamB/YcsF family protein [Chitinophagaceae bacterium]